MVEKSEPQNCFHYILLIKRAIESYLLARLVKESDLKLKETQLLWEVRSDRSLKE